MTQPWRPFTGWAPAPCDPSAFVDLRLRACRVGDSRYYEFDALRIQASRLWDVGAHIPNSTSSDVIIYAALPGQWPPQVIAWRPHDNHREDRVVLMRNLLLGTQWPAPEDPNPVPTIPLPAPPEGFVEPPQVRTYIVNPRGGFKCAPTDPELLRRLYEAARKGRKK